MASIGAATGPRASPVREGVSRKNEGSPAMVKAALRPLAADMLYETDFHAWAQAQAWSLAHRDDDGLDVANLIEEVESLGRSQRNALLSRLDVLIAHLLKFRIQPERAGPSWRRTVREQRRQIERLLARNPSLRGLPREALPDVYRDAVWTAADETRLAEAAFPATCPFTIEDILDPDFEP